MTIPGCNEATSSELSQQGPTQKSNRATPSPQLPMVFCTRHFLTHISNLDISRECKAIIVAMKRIDLFHEQITLAHAGIS